MGGRRSHRSALSVLQVLALRSRGLLIFSTDEVQDCLGVGSTGAVLRALDRSSGVVVAVKIANTAADAHDKKIANEAAMYMKMVSKPSPAVQCVFFVTTVLRRLTLN